MSFKIIVQATRSVLDDDGISCPVTTTSDVVTFDNQYLADKAVESVMKQCVDIALSDGQFDVEVFKLY